MARECLEEFLRIYESEPCLWRVKSKEYHDKNKKEAAYARLVETLRFIEPQATRDTVVKKINSLRSVFRKEKKKILASQKHGEPYEPRLWYFKIFKFLDGQDAQDTQNSPPYHQDTEDYSSDCVDVYTEANTWQDSNDWEDTKPENNPFQIEDAPPEPTFTPQPSRRLQPFKRSLPSSMQDDSLDSEVLLAIRDHLKRPRLSEDRLEIFAKNVAIKMRDLPKQQMLLAEKLVNEVLFHAEMGDLNLSFKLVDGSDKQ